MRGCLRQLDTGPRQVCFERLCQFREVHGGPHLLQELADGETLALDQHVTFTGLAEGRQPHRQGSERIRQRASRNLHRRRRHHAEVNAPTIRVSARQGRQHGAQFLGNWSAVFHGLAQTPTDCLGSLCQQAARVVVSVANCRSRLVAAGRGKHHRQIIGVGTHRLVVLRSGCLHAKSFVRNAARGQQRRP